MLNGIYLISIIFGVTLQNVLKKPYTKRTGNSGAFIFNAILSFSALVFFAITSDGLSFNLSFLPYSAGFAIAYCTTSVFTVFAISAGSLSLTSLFISYSLTIPTLYGLLFLGDPLSGFFIVGMILLMISLFLVNKKDGEIKISPKWLIYTILAFAGNGFCTVLQKMQQNAFNGEYKNEFMIAALIIVTAINLTVAFVRERHDIQPCVKAGWHLAIACGVMNGMVNLFVMILSARMPVSVMFPLISAGGLVITYLLARVVYKEKLSKLQLTGFALGTLSIIFFNL